MCNIRHFCQAGGNSPCLALTQKIIHCILFNVSNMTSLGPVPRSSAMATLRPYTLGLLQRLKLKILPDREST